MPTAADGNWHPENGWDGLRQSIRVVVDLDAVRFVERFMDVCVSIGCAPAPVFRDWCFWGKPKCGKIENWPKYLTAAEWDALATFAETVVVGRVRQAEREREIAELVTMKGNAS